MDFFIFHQITPIKDFFYLVDSLDAAIFNWVNQFALQWVWLDTLAIFFAQYLGYILILFLFLLLIRNFKKYWSMVAQALLAAIFARLIIVEIIRYFLPKSRPFVENSVNLLMNHSQEPAFPSGHAAFYFAIATIIYFYNKKAGLLFIAASFLISLSRVFAGIHWPSDILVGAVIGILSGFFILRSSQKFSLLVRKQKLQQE